MGRGGCGGGAPGGFFNIHFRGVESLFVMKLVRWFGS